MFKEDKEPINKPLRPWPVALDLPMANQVKHLKNLMLSRPFLTRIPDQTIIVDEQTDNEEYVIATRDSEGTYAMQMKLLAGRVFTENDSDFKGLIINRFLAEKLGYTPEKAVGARLRFPNADDLDRSVIGVVENIVMGSATVPQQSLTLGFDQQQRMAFLVVRVEEDNQQEVLLAAQKLWEKYGSTFPFSYTFLNDQLDELLGKEDRLYNLLLFGSLLIIFISCLGIFGLVSYTAVQRTKEIGIRKVLGAKSPSLFYVVIRDFLSSSVVAFLMATALGWFIGIGWLENFAYRTHFEWNNVMIAGIISIVITLFTLSYHTLKVIKTNPVDSIKE